jgi:hypothetical protein
MKKIPFTSGLAPATTRLSGGFAAGGPVDPCQWADEVFGGEVPGPWLCCYMLRRFGWPNSGSDDLKDLCRWVLTTPMPGLYLGISPYLGGSNLHFSVRFNKAVGSQITIDPGRTSYFSRRRKAIGRWWARKGRHLYTFGVGTKEGDSDELIHLYAEEDGKVAGLWRRTPAHTWPNRIPGKNGWVVWWLGEFIAKRHPEVRLPKMTKKEIGRRMSRFQIRVRAAVKATLRDLLRPTRIRDLSFSPFGDIDRTPEAVRRYSGQEETGYFEGAGIAPQYWFRPRRIARRRIRGAKRA